MKAQGRVGSASRNGEGGRTFPLLGRAGHPSPFCGTEPRRGAKRPGFRVQLCPSSPRTSLLLGGGCAPPGKPLPRPDPQPEMGSKQEAQHSRPAHSACGLHPRTSGPAAPCSQKGEDGGPCSVRGLTVTFPVLAALVGTPDEHGLEAVGAGGHGRGFALHLHELHGVVVLADRHGAVTQPPRLVLLRREWLGISRGQPGPTPAPAGGWGTGYPGQEAAHCQPPHCSKGGVGEKGAPADLSPKVHLKPQWWHRASGQGCLG